MSFSCVMLVAVRFSMYMDECRAQLPALLWWWRAHNTSCNSKQSKQRRLVTRFRSWQRLAVGCLCPTRFKARCGSHLLTRQQGRRPAA